MENNDAANSFFSKFDNEEETLVDFSDSSSEKQEVETKEVKEVINPEQTKEETSKEAKVETKEEEKVDENTPFHKHPRWQQKLANEKKLKEENKNFQLELEKMREEIQAMKSKPLTDEQLNDMTPQEIMEHTKRQLELEYNQKQELQTKSDAEADKYIEDSLEELKDKGHKFDENKLLKYADEYTSGDIAKAFELYNMIDQSKEKGAEEEAKMSEKKKQAQSNSSNRGQTGKVSGYVRGTGWNNLDLK